MDEFVIIKYVLGPWLNETDLIEFKLYRSNRMQRLYENVWLWKDINIGPHGYFIFSLPVPKRPALWMVSSVGVSPKTGFGLLRSPIVVSAHSCYYLHISLSHHHSTKLMSFTEQLS